MNTCKKRKTSPQPLQGIQSMPYVLRARYAYACGTLREQKKEFLILNFEFLMREFERDRVEMF